jgi:hypothetical protein
MSSKRFSKVYPALWRSKRFTGLSSSDCKLLYLYLLTSEHQTSAGAYAIPDGYVATDMAWDLERYREARDELVKAGLIAFDPETTEVYIERWFKHSPPMNNKHAQGIQRLIGEIESEAILLKAQEQFEVAAQARVPEPHPFDSPSKVAELGRMRGGLGR